MLIEIKDLFHVYNPETPLSNEALSGVNLSIDRGELLALVGETGSGKTTLVLHLNGLLLPTRGSVRVGDVVVTPQTKKTGKLREMVGIVFQYPEHQLFEETVFKEISFGLIHGDFDLTERQREGRVREAARKVNLDIDVLSGRTPFSLSGGEQRKVAIASILAMDPDILIFDEPTQGLDAESRAETLRQIVALNRRGKTIIIISHDMEEILPIVRRVVVLKGGKNFIDVSSAELFSEFDNLMGIRHLLPEVAELLIRLKEKGWNIQKPTCEAEEAIGEIRRCLGRDQVSDVSVVKKGL
jgi:energy-coupling factor transport system ATP-binding protein